MEGVQSQGGLKKTFRGGGWRESSAGEVGVMLRGARCFFVNRKTEASGPAASGAGTVGHRTVGMAQPPGLVRGGGIFLMNFC